MMVDTAVGLTEEAERLQRVSVPQQAIVPLRQRPRVHARRADRYDGAESLQTFAAQCRRLVIITVGVSQAFVVIANLVTVVGDRLEQVGLEGPWLHPHVVGACNAEPGFQRRRCDGRTREAIDVVAIEHDLVRAVIAIAILVIRVKTDELIPRLLECRQQAFEHRQREVSHGSHFRL